VHKDVRASLVWFDENEALLGIEKLYSASLGHASGPFLSAHHPHGQHCCIALAGACRQFSQFEGKGPLYLGVVSKRIRASFLNQADRNNLAFPARNFIKDFPCSKNARTALRVLCLSGIGKQKFFNVFRRAHCRNASVLARIANFPSPRISF
jgi:hypothetical protein